MGKTAVEEYEVWNLSPLYIPPRSTLYALEPMGVGTPWVESLTSYIARLADAHCVFSGTLIYKMIVPLLSGYTSDERQHPLFRADGNKSNLINGTGPRAIAALEALETLTGRADLRPLTLVAWEEVFPLRGLIRLTKAWCPACYEEWRTVGKVIYDPLLWVLQEVPVCVHHQQRLRTSCPYPECARSLPALTWRSRPGYCAYCHRWLGVQLEETASVLEEGELMWQQWVTQALGTLLAHAPVILLPPERQRMQEVLVALINRITQGNVAAFARILEMSPQMVFHWRYGGRTPEIAMLLRLCYLLNLTPYEVFCNDPETLRPQLRDESSLKPSPAKRRKKTEIDRAHIFQVLEDAARNDEQPSPSLAEVARRLGFGYSDIHYLYECHRDACSVIAARHLMYRQQRREARMQGYREEITQIALQLQKQGIWLTQKHIAPHMAQQGILRDPKVRELLWEVCRELETNGGEKSL